MSKETVGEVVKWAKGICEEEKVKYLKLIFLGGEPLNNIDNLLLMVDLFNKHLPQLQDPFWDTKYMLSTNGDLITDSILRELKSRRIWVSLNPSNSSMGDLEDKILKVKEVNGGCALLTVLNDANLPRAVDLAKLAVRHACFIRMNRMFQGSSDPEYIREYGSQLGKMMDIFLAAKRVAWPNWMVDSTMPVRFADIYSQTTRNCYSCGEWLFTIDWDGMIRSCNADPDTVIGYIRTHKHRKDFKFPHRWSAANLPECQGCKWIVLCQGGCPYCRKVAYGTYDKKTPFCEVHRDIWPKLMELTERWKLSHSGLFTR
jgi:radical SAM protein with 4Fe4S-binding SPASM domain